MQEIRTYLFTVIISVACFPILAIAEDTFPEYANLFNTSSTQSLDIECTKISSLEIECKFTEKSVLKVTKPSDIEKELARGESELKTAKKDPKQCLETNIIVEALETGNYSKISKDPKKTPKYIQNLKEIEKRDFINQMKAFAMFSCNPNKETMKEVILIMHDIHMRTCKITNRTFIKKFTRNLKTKRWENISNTGSKCGMIVFSYFEKEDDYLWKYSTKNIVTNEKEKINGKECGNFGNIETTYDWHSNDRYVGCDYVRF